MKDLAIILIQVIIEAVSIPCRKVRVWYWRMRGVTFIDIIPCDGRCINTNAGMCEACCYEEACTWLRANPPNFVEDGSPTPFDGVDWTRGDNDGS